MRCVCGESRHHHLNDGPCRNQTACGCVEYLADNGLDDPETNPRRHWEPYTGRYANARQ